ncbi:MAG: PDZ domain-containing protein, partial [Oligoflexia bacterium]|nr:PDZ domain-containing protein [Oligoflexia bacterium]
AGPKPPRKSDFIDPIVTRSIFDSTKVGSTSSGDDGENGAEGGEAKSDIDATLLATVVADPAQYSSALISHKGGEDATGYGIGDSLFGEGTVVSVEPRRVIIERNDGSREYIAMDLDAKVQKSTGRVLRNAKDDSEDGVEKVSDTKFIVDADLIEEAMKNPEKLASQIRVSPHKDASGTIDGYRLSGIRRNSLFKKLGIKNGDVVHAVNGQSLTSMSSAMSAYESLQNDKNFSFDVTRRNKRNTYEYEIR